MTPGARIAYFFGDDDLSIDRAVGRFGRDLAAGGEPLERWLLRGSRNGAVKPSPCGDWRGYRSARWRDAWGSQKAP